MKNALSKSPKKIRSANTAKKRKNKRTTSSNIEAPRVRCRGCNKSHGVIKFYIIADDMENPKPYHPACIRNLYIEVIMKLSDTKAQINAD